MTITERDIRDHVVVPSLGDAAADYDIDALTAAVLERWPLERWRFEDLAYRHIDMDLEEYWRLVAGYETDSTRDPGPAGLAPPIAEFVTAQLDRDEAHARKDIAMAAEAGPDWSVRVGVNLPHSYLRDGDGHGNEVAKVTSPTHAPDASLMARFKPRTVRARAEHTLTDIAVKRRLIEMYVDLDRDPARRTDEMVHAHWCILERVMCAFASAYSDAPGFDRHWHFPVGGVRR